MAALRRRGDAVRALARDPHSPRLPADVEKVRFDVNDPAPDPQALAGLDAIVHLAGESVDGRWTPAKKRAIFDSRVGGTRNLVTSLAALDRRPSVLVCASAIGYYGNRGDELLDDESPPGSDFLAGVCVAWEREAREALKLGVRVASARTAMVLGRGGALAKLLPIFRFGIGGPLGNGRQWMPWIHIDDLADLYCLVLDRDSLSGPIAAVAPDYATNARVMQAVGHALGRPALAPAPGFALKIALGEFAETLLGGQLIAPRKASEAGFEWRHPDLEAAVIHAVDPTSTRKPATQLFQSEQFVDAPREKVFAFFSDGRNLERLTPPAMHLRATSAGPVEMRRGAIIDYTMRVRWIGVRWRALIVDWIPGERFTDIQLRGPYLWWRHTHEFEMKGAGVVVRDRIDYALPFAPFSDLALPSVRHDIETAFTFRRRAIEEVFAA